MKFESAQSNTTAKLPILKLGEYEMWVIRIKQYFQVQDYALWEVIENGNSWVSIPQTAQENGTSVTKMSVPVTAEEKTNKKNDVKVRSLLLMALSNEHQLTFSLYSDSKTIFAAIETRFEGNEATKKTQKTPLKQQYENFSASSTKSLDSIFNRLQKITNKADIETMSIDDLYNNFKIVEQDVKKSIGASSGAENLAFLTTLSTSSTNDDLEQINEDDLEAIDLKWHLSLLGMREKRYFQRIGKKNFINANDTAGYDKSKVECFNCHKMGHFARENANYTTGNQDNTRKQGNNEDTSSKEMLDIDGVGLDWSDMTEEQVQTNMALMAFSDSERSIRLGTHTPPHPLIYNRSKKIDFSYSSLDEFKEPEFKSYGSQGSKQESNIVCDKKSDASKENSDDSLVKEQVSEDTSSFVESPLNIEKETVFLDKKIEIVKPKNHEKPVKKSVRTYPNAQRNMVPRAVLMKTGLKPLNTARTVNTAHPKSTVFSAKSMSCFSKSAQSTIRRPYQSKTLLSNKRFTQTNNIAKAKAVNTTRPKAVNTTRPHSTVVNAVRFNQANAVKSLACWVWRPTKL
ncbi:ribonuclease H-like domain-containing protein, partial [Tanacetum coccineum]